MCAVMATEIRECTHNVTIMGNNIISYHIKAVLLVNRYTLPPFIMGELNGCDGGLFDISSSFTPCFTILIMVLVILLTREIKDTCICIQMNMIRRFTNILSVIIGASHHIRMLCVIATINP
jgi:hypothetical protein